MFRCDQPVMGVCQIGGSLKPSFPRKPESSLFNMFWTLAFAGVTGGEQVITFDNDYRI